MEALQILFDKIRTCLEEHEALDRALANQEEDDVESDGEETAESKQLRRDYNVANKEVQLLNNSVPEGLPDDCEFQYFLTLAELQKNIDELKAIKAMSEKNLAFMEQQFQLNENLVMELQEKKKELLQKQSEQSGQSEKSAEKEASKELDKRIRATKLVYKEIKTFLGQFLVDVAPDSQEVSRLAHLMQDLYSSFTDKGPDVYVSFSNMPYASLDDLNTLVRHNIVERCPDPQKKDMIRLVNFTE